MPDPSIGDGTVEEIRAYLKTLQARVAALEEGGVGGGGGEGSTSESITTVASPVAADPDISVTIVSTSGDEDAQVVTLADNSTDAPFIKTFEVIFSNENDTLSISVANAEGFSSPVLVVNENFSDSAIVQFVWNPTISKWQPIFGKSFVVDAILNLNDGELIIRNGSIQCAGNGSIDLNSGEITTNTGRITVGASGGTGNFYQNTQDAAGLVGPSRHALISGGVAGDLTVTGIATDDRLDEVFEFSSGALSADRTSEFAIIGDNTINNSGGANTSGKQLIVRWTHSNV